MADNSAQFVIDLEGNARSIAGETGRALEDLRAKFQSSDDRVKQLNQSLRGLTGKSAEVVAAKETLKAAINRERTSMNEASLAIQKQGFSYGALAAHAKASQQTTDGASKAVKAIGGPLQEAHDRLDALKGMFEGANKGAVLLAGGAALALVAIAALTAGVVAGTVALAKWILAGADAARSMQLLREGAVLATGNASDLGDAVDALAKKVPIARSELNDMATELYRTFNNTTLVGDGFRATMSIVAQATGAAGAKVASTLEGMIERGKRFGRLQIIPQELQGTGIHFEDVAAELAKQLHIGLGQAKQALFQGTVELNAGAKALSATVNKRFEELNARKLLSFPMLIMKFHESLDELTSGVKIEPLGKAVKSLFSVFDSSTASGQAIKGLVTVIGDKLVGGLVAAAPLVRGLFLGIGSAALDLGIVVLRVALFLKKTFGLDGPSHLLTFQNAVNAGKVAVYAMAVGLGVAAVATLVLTAPIWLAVAALYGLWKIAGLVADGILIVADGLGDLATMGLDAAKGLIDGFIGGIKKGWNAAGDAVRGLADSVSSSFKDALGIHSPSKLFASFGDATVAGYVGALQDGAGDAQDAANVLAPGSPGGAFGGAGGGARGAGGGAGTIVNVTINAPGANQATVKAMAEPSFLAELVHTIEHALQGAGVLTQAGAS